MSVDLARRTLNQIDSELVALERKLSDSAKKESDKTKRINDIQKSITKNTSPTMLNSKMRQIQAFQNELTRILSDKAQLNKKIADKRKKRADASVKLQNEEAAESKKQSKVQLSIQQGYERRIADLSAQLTTQVASLTPAHFATHIDKAVEKYDVFISHAWEDKADFADEFVEELTTLGICVWYDKNQILWGDNMRAKIDEGLRKSKFGIAVISPNYIADGKYWTKAELDGLFQLESVNGKMLLPIWHNITKKEVMEYSPIIAGRLAMTTAAMTPKEIANELKQLLDKMNTEEQCNG